MSIRYKIDVLSALKEAGYNTNRIRKEKIMGEQAFLLDCWNKRTDGLKVDVNQHFGICPIRSRHLSISSSISPKSSITKRSNAAI